MEKGWKKGAVMLTKDLDLVRVRILKEYSKEDSSLHDMSRIIAAGTRQQSTCVLLSFYSLG